MKIILSIIDFIWQSIKQGLIGLSVALSLMGFILFCLVWVGWPALLVNYPPWFALLFIFSSGSLIYLAEKCGLDF
jgi:threonine/homoserine/homoserine lactone efflux protein